MQKGSSIILPSLYCLRNKHFVNNKGFLYLIIESKNMIKNRRSRNEVYIKKGYSFRYYFSGII